MSKSFLVDINLNKHELQNASLQNLGTAPSSPVEGQMYYNTADDTPYIYANGSWLDMGVQGGAGATDLGATAAATTFTITSSTGDDAVITAADGTNSGVMTNAMYTKLAGIEVAADVTDSTNVDAAGAVMNSDTSTASMSFVIDEDSMATNSATKVPTQQSTKAYVDATVAAVVDAAPGTLDTLNELAAALGDDANYASTVTTALGTKAPLASPSFTGTVTLPTGLTGTLKATSGVVSVDTSVAHKVTATYGDGTTTAYAITHGLGTQWPTVQVYEVSTGNMVEVDVTVTSSTVVTITHAVAPTTNQYRYVIVG